MFALPDENIRAENWTREACELEGYAVTVCSCQLGEAYVAQIESPSGHSIALAVSKIAEEARREVFETASRRLLRTRHFDLTVGG
jgi:hypothetical protein